MKFRTEPAATPDKPGLQVLDLDAADLADPAVRRDLHDLWAERGLLVFRSLNGGETQVSLSRCFGELVPHPIREFWVDGHPELIDLKYNPDEGVLYDLDGVEIGAWLPWHSDLMYMDKVNHGGVLRAITIAPSGGQTGFIDQIAAYDRLPASVQESIEGRYVIYKQNPDVGLNKFLKDLKVRMIRSTKAYDSIMQRLDEFPRVLHPMVFTHPETGKKVLNVSPWHALGVQGQENEEGDALLEEVFKYCLDPAYAYFHDWRPGDMLAWDNWRMLHCVQGIPRQSSRWMQRTTIFGDYAQGRLEAAEAATELWTPEHA